MNYRYFKILKENFGVKVFVTFTLFIFVVSLYFSVFFVRNQSKFMTDTMIKNGMLLTGILAHNSRIGVFSENEELLRDPIDGIFEQEGVLEVSVYNLNKELLKMKEKHNIRKPEKIKKDADKERSKIFAKLTQSGTPFYIDGNKKIEFWSPVVSGSAYAAEESLFLEKDPLKSEQRIIGFVSIAVNRELLRRRIDSLLVKSLLIGIIFLIIGSAVAYFVVKGITRPLNKLTNSVKALGMGGVVERIPVETKDEIGKLANAFNNMSESLKNRELEKEHLEEQLRHAQKMEAIGTLAGGIAHDFNNILTAIMGFGNLLQIKIDRDTPSRHHVDQILCSAERAANLTRSLLAFSRKQLINLRPINLNECILNIQTLLGRLIREDIEIEVELTEGQLIIMADSGQMDQVMMNLATNARDAMPYGGMLTISTKPVELTVDFFQPDEIAKPGSYAQLTISDAGTGMDEKTKERIFDPFFTTKEVGKGTGLGLSMIYGIIKQHDGYIDVTSQAGKGTTFDIYLPLVHSKVTLINIKSLNSPKKGRETVLIAEDDEVVRKLAKEIFTKNGYKVIEAADGEDAIRKFYENQEDIELLLVDIIMPKKNGKEVYEEIVKIKPNIKVLFTSGYASDVINEKELAEEGKNFISKPVSLDDLLRKVREVLDEN